MSDVGRQQQHNIRDFKIDVVWTVHPEAQHDVAISVSVIQTELNAVLAPDIEHARQASVPCSLRLDA
jgi:hypothetical protein